MDLNAAGRRPSTPRRRAVPHSHLALRWQADDHTNSTLVTSAAVLLEGLLPTSSRRAELDWPLPRRREGHPAAVVACRRPHDDDKSMSACVGGVSLGVDSALPH